MNYLHPGPIQALIAARSQSIGLLLMKISGNFFYKKVKKGPGETDMNPYVHTRTMKLDMIALWRQSYRMKSDCIFIVLKKSERSKGVSTQPLRLPPKCDNSRTGNTAPSQAQGRPGGTGTDSLLYLTSSLNFISEKMELP